MSILVWYLAAINFTTWVVYGLDKGRAKSGKWRIPERTLLLLALVGGSLGALAGMIMFRHFCCLLWSAAPWARWQA